MDRLIAHGEAAGGAKHLVGLQAEDLLNTACHQTGLSDFGQDNTNRAAGAAAQPSWRDHLDVLLTALENESDLHLLGRMIVRSEVLAALANRLRLAELWRRQPQILETPVNAPVFIVGSPRSGTSILHELMACDEASRAPALWEMVHPLGDEQNAAISDRVHRFWSDIQPEYDTMHANSGYLANECIFITLHEFLSDHWGGNHVVPSYDLYLARSDQHQAYRFHKRFLQTLAHRCGPNRWLLKAPSHLFQLRTLFDVYPDARIIRTHRDPLKTLPSSLNLMGTLKWMRCNQVDLAAAAQHLPAGYAYVYEREIRHRNSGVLPDSRFIDVQFEALVRDPVNTVESIYAQLEWPFTTRLRDATADYAAKKPKGSRGEHQYSLAQLGIDAQQERERFDFYTRHYGIAAED